VVVLDYGGFATFDETMYRSLEVAAKVLNRETRAKAIVEYMENIRHELNQKSKQYTKQIKPRVYVGGVGFRGSHGIESSEQKYIPFLWNNVNNVASNVKSLSGSHVFLDKETLLNLNPDLIFLDGGGLNLIEHDFKRKPEIFQNLKAFREKKVYSLFPFNFYATNVDTALCDAYAVSKILYPEGFMGLDLAKKADEIYEFFVGKGVYREMAKQYGELGAIPEFLRTERR
jgi:iron complex transport system substrate-binding protein